MSSWTVVTEDVAHKCIATLTAASVALIISGFTIARYLQTRSKLDRTDAPLLDTLIISFGYGMIASGNFIISAALRLTGKMTGTWCTASFFGIQVLLIPSFIMDCVFFLSVLLIIVGGPSITTSQALWCALAASLYSFYIGLFAYSQLSEESITQTKFSIDEPWCWLPSTPSGNDTTEFLTFLHWAAAFIWVAISAILGAFSFFLLWWKKKLQEQFMGLRLLAFVLFVMVQAVIIFNRSSSGNLALQFLQAVLEPLFTALNCVLFLVSERATLLAHRDRSQSIIGSFSGVVGEGITALAALDSIYTFTIAFCETCSYKTFGYFVVHPVGMLAVVAHAYLDSDYTKLSVSIGSLFVNGLATFAARVSKDRNTHLHVCFTLDFFLLFLASIVLQCLESAEGDAPRDGIGGVVILTSIALAVTTAFQQLYLVDPVDNCSKSGESEASVINYAVEWRRRRSLLWYLAGSLTAWGLAIMSDVLAFFLAAFVCGVKVIFFYDGLQTVVSQGVSRQETRESRSTDANENNNNCNNSSTSRGVDDLGGPMSARLLEQPAA